MSLTNINDLHEMEAKVRTARKIIANASLRTFLADGGESLGDDGAMPTVAIAVSGGGLRATVTTLGAMDGLLEIGLLDGVTYAAGLSGSTWALGSWMIGKKQVSPKCNVMLKLDADPWSEGVPDQHTCEHDHRSEGHDKRCCGVEFEGNILTPFVREFFTKSDPDYIDSYQKFLLKVLPPRGSVDHQYGDIADVGDLLSGKLPIPLLTAITPAEKDNRDERREHQWVEFTPWEIAMTESGLAGKMNRTYGNLMAICGSAFAFHWGYLVRNIEDEEPRSFLSMFKDRIVKHWRDNTHGILESVARGDFEERIPHPTEPNREIPVVDAGIDFNIPLPPLCPSTVRGKARAVDVIIIFDASGNATSPNELHEAWERGYIKVRPGDEHHLKDKFAEEGPGCDNVFRVFWPVDDGPLMIYILGLTDQDTKKFTYTADEVEDLSNEVTSKVVELKGRIRDTIGWWVENKRQDGALPPPDLPTGCPNTAHDQERRHWLRASYWERFTTWIKSWFN